MPMYVFTSCANALPAITLLTMADWNQLFGPTIVSLSLLSPCLITFKRASEGLEIPLLLPVNSLLVMTGKSRYDFTHEISKKTVEELPGCDGESIERDRRISLVFRTVAGGNKQDEEDDGSPY